MERTRSEKELRPSLDAASASSVDSRSAGIAGLSFRGVGADCVQMGGAIQGSFFRCPPTLRKESYSAPEGRTSFLKNRKITPSRGRRCGEELGVDGRYPHARTDELPPPSYPTHTHRQKNNIQTDWGGEGGGTGWHTLDGRRSPGNNWRRAGTNDAERTGNGPPSPPPTPPIYIFHRTAFTFCFWG